jgi:hypothetical protein
LGELKGQAGQAAAQPSRRALDGQIQQSQTTRGWLDGASRLATPLFGYQNHASPLGFFLIFALPSQAHFLGRFN